MKSVSARILLLLAFPIILALLFQVGAAQAQPLEKRVYREDAAMYDLLGWGADPGLAGRVKRLHLVQYRLEPRADGTMAPAPGASPLYETTMTFDREGTVRKEVRKDDFGVFITGENDSGDVAFFGNEASPLNRYVLSRDAKGHPRQLDSYAGDKHIRVEAHFTCDEAGRVISEINSLHQITNSAYDDQGRRIREEVRTLVENGTSRRLKLTCYAYDGEGRLTRTDVQNFYSYDRNGRLAPTDAQNFFGRGRHFGEDREYDAAGRLLRVQEWMMRHGKRVFAPVPMEERIYDPAGRLIRKFGRYVQPTGFVFTNEVRYHYDAGGHLTSLVRTEPGAAVARLTFANDSRGNWIRCVRAQDGASSLFLRDIDYYPEEEDVSPSPNR